MSIKEVRHNIQKERRIIDTLEPVLNSHRLIVDTNVIRRDYQSAMTYPIERQAAYQLIHQLSRLTKHRGALLQDDRLDALAIAVAYWVESMAADADNRMDDRKNDLLTEELERFTNSFYKQNGKVTATTWV